MIAADPERGERSSSAPDPNPYASPGAGVADLAAPRTIALHWHALVVALVFGAIAGAALVVETGVVMSRFGGADYVPFTLLLSMIRGSASAHAATAAVIVGVLALHRAATSADAPRLDFAWAGVATLAATIPAGVGILGAAILASAEFGVSPARYLEFARMLRFSDALFGTSLACLHAALAAVVLHVGRRLWCSRSRALVVKWIVGFVAVRFVVGLAGALVALALE